jgi:heptosyltransferase-2
MAAERILVRGVNWLGDAVMTTPALRRLREAKPGAHIALLTPEKLADLWRKHPSLDATISFGAADTVFKVARGLREECFTTALVFPNSPRSAIEVFFAGIPERIGYRRSWRNFFLTRTVKSRPDALAMHKRSPAEIRQRVAANLPRETFPAGAHHTFDYLNLVAQAGASAEPIAPQLRVEPSEVQAFKNHRRVPDDALLFGLNPGAEYGAAKRWPSERFVEAAVALHRATGCRWVLFGGNGDRDLCAEITAGITKSTGADAVTNIAGQTTLRELCAGLKACALVLTNDTGPMHVAAAVGTPVVVPLGSTSSELTGPQSANGLSHELLSGAASCAPCFLRECPIDFRCMKSITVDEVVAAALRVWKRAERR